MASSTSSIGRDASVRQFWQDVDRAVDARGALLTAFDQMAALVRDFHTQQAQARGDERQWRAGVTATWATHVATGDCGCGTVVVGRWTGQGTRALREELRMTVHDFARYLGVVPVTVSGWEHRHTSTSPATMAAQAALDETLTLADSNAKARFLLLLDTPNHDG
ncbi:helix-turn-helix domain-containing protein [Micromonospora radicis]|uniref:helix-turn-helix domain-containing protein n=1 Tax=Micromonospora radicis TaxID=1894971 RepID=UPI0011C45B88|nr:helix-turn-helix transcriptional regulator [Micromonospora radicis]